MGLILGAIAGGLQGASKGLESMEQSKERRWKENRQSIMDALSQQNVQADNKRLDADLDLRREENGYSKDESGHWSFDPSNTREARVAKIKDQQEAQKISASEVAYIAAGMNPAQASAAARNPGIADNYLFPKPDPIQQATQIHRINHSYDVAHPLPSRAGAGRTTSANASIQPLVHRGALVRGQLRDTDKQIADNQKVVSGGLFSNATPQDSAAYRTAQAAVAPGGKLTARRDSLSGVMDQIGAQMAGQPAATAQPAQAVIPQAAFDQEAMQYKAALDRIKATEKDPARQAHKLQAAQQIYNARVAEISKGIK